MTSTASLFPPDRRLRFGVKVGGIDSCSKVYGNATESRFVTVNAALTGQLTYRIQYIYCLWYVGDL